MADQTTPPAPPRQHPEIAAESLNPSPAPEIEAPPGDETQQRVAALYDRWVQQVQEAYENGRDKGREGLDSAIAAARARFEAAGEFSSAQGEQFRAWLERDFGETAEHLRQFGDEARERLNPSRIGAGALASLSALLTKASDALAALSKRTEDAVTYGTGEVTTAGTLTCLACGKTMRLRRTAHIPPCPACSATKFRKGY